MGVRYKKKSAFDMAYDRGKRAIRTRLADLKAEMENELLAEFTKQFIANEAKGVLVELRADDEEMLQLLRRAAQRQLEDGE